MVMHHAEKLVLIEDFVELADARPDLSVFCGRILVAHSLDNDTNGFQDER